MQVVWHKANRNSPRKPVGVFVGHTGVQLFDVKLDLYMSFFVKVAAFSIKTSSDYVTRGQKNPQQSQRMSYHTFRRGDIVYFKDGATDEDATGEDATGTTGEEPELVEAAVFGVCISDYTGTSQGRRFLVLYDLKLEVFFISTWPLWSRTLEPQKTKVEEEWPDIDGNCVAVKTLSVEDCQRMLGAWESGGKLKVLGYKTAGAANSAAKMPPSMRAGERERKKKEVAEQKEKLALEKKKAAQEKRVKEKAAKDHAARAAAARRGRGRGSQQQVETLAAGSKAAQKAADTARARARAKTDAEKADAAEKAAAAEQAATAAEEAAALAAQRDAAAVPKKDAISKGSGWEQAMFGGNIEEHPMYTADPFADTPYSPPQDDRSRQHDRREDRYYSRDRRRGRSRGRSRDRSRDRSHDRSRDRSHDRSRGRSRDRSCDRSHDRSRGRNRDRSRDRSDDRSHADRSHDRMRRSYASIEPTPESEIQIRRSLRRLEGEQKVERTRETQGMIEELKFDLETKRKRRFAGAHT